MAFAFGRLVFSRCSRRAVHEPLPGGWRRNLSIASPATGPFSGRPLRNAKRPIDYLPAAVAIEPAPLQYRTSRLRAVRPNMVDSGESNNSVDEQPTRWQEVQIPTPWGHLAAKVWGRPGSGLPVLALHGWQDNAGTFDKLMELLPEDLYVVCLDFAGHGHSSQYPPGLIYHYWDHLVHCRLVVRHFGWSRFRILGHSLGGLVGSMLAAVMPNEVERLVMIDIVKAISCAAEKQPDRTIKALAGYEAVMNKLEKTPPSYTWEAARQRLMEANGGSLDADAADVLMRRGTTRTADGLFSFARDLRHVIPSLSGYTEEQHVQFAKRVQCPHLIIKADKGPMYEGRQVHERFVQLYRDSNARFRYVDVEGTHHVHLVRADVVAPHVVQFFAEP